jgi:hypothetical protein
MFKKQERVRVERAIIKNFKIMIATSPYIRLIGLLCKKEDCSSSFSPPLLFIQGGSKMVDFSEKVKCNKDVRSLIKWATIILRSYTVLNVIEARLQATPCRNRCNLVI